MRSATFCQRNISKGFKNGLMEMKELLDRIFFYRQTAAKYAQKVEIATLPTENIVSAK